MATSIHSSMRSRSLWKLAIWAWTALICSGRMFSVVLRPRRLAELVVGAGLDGRVGLATTARGPAGVVLLAQGSWAQVAQAHHFGP